MINLKIGFLFSCGSDDSGSSGDTTTSEEQTTTKTDDEILLEALIESQTVTPPDTCAINKLCPGMTKDEVLTILGEPDELERRGKEWHWIVTYDNRDTHTVCTPSAWLNKCYLRFDGEWLVGQQNIKVEFLDLNGWGL